MPCVQCYSHPVTKRAEEAVWDLESSPRVPRGELSGRFAARRKETKKEHRSFGTIIETRGRFKVRYTGPDRKIHRAGITFTTRERAQGWLFEERKLIELDEWTPPSLRRAQVHKDELTLDEFAGDWIAKRLVRGRPLKDRTREHYLDTHERWFTALHDLQLASITQADIDRWYHALPAAPTMRIHAYSLLKAMYRTAVTRAATSTWPKGPSPLSRPPSLSVGNDSSPHLSPPPGTGPSTCHRTSPRTSASTWRSSPRPERTRWCSQAMKASRSPRGRSTVTDRLCRTVGGAGVGKPGQDFVAASVQGPSELG